MNELKRLWKAFRHSWDGLCSTYHTEAAFRLEVRLSVLLIPLSIYLGENNFERSLLLGSWLLVPMVELLNSAIEAITDYATKTERHDLAKKAKDAGSAAVLVATVIWAITWACILLS